MQQDLCDLKATRAYITLSLRRTFFSPLSCIAALLCLTPFILIVLRRGSIEPLAIATLLLTITALILHRFLTEKLENDDVLPLFEGNLGCVLASSLLQKLKAHEHMHVSTLLQAILSTTRGAFVLREIGLTKMQFSERYAADLHHPADLSHLLLKGKELLPLVQERRVGPGILLLVLCGEEQVLKHMLDENDLSLEDLTKIIQMEALHHRITSQKKGIFHPHSLLENLGSVGRSWVMGYTDDLDRFTQDISPRIHWRAGHGITIHQEALKSILHILARSEQHNVLIVGKKGVGKQSLAENVAECIRNFEVERGLPYTRILVLKTEQLLSGSERPDIALLRAFARASGREHFLLLIKNVALFLQAADPRLKVVLSRVLQARNIRVIGIANAGDYHTLIRTDPAIHSAFERVNITDATDSETMLVLMEHYFRLRDRWHITVTYDAFRAILTLTRQYVGEGGYPGKAIEVLEDALLAAREQRKELVREPQIREVVSLKAHMDVQKVGEEERWKLLHLEEVLQRRIIGQEEAIEGVVHALKRSRLNIGDGKKPYGTFLFLGPTGVGKTHTAKAIAEEMFGSEESFVRLDMNEFSTESAVEDITGTSGSSEGFLAQHVQDHPSSLILLDEIEKAHPKVLNLFLQVLDEGFLTDREGIRTDFRSTIIIATSNAGALFIRNFAREHPHWDRKSEGQLFRDHLIDTILKEKTFAPEFLNRFDKVVVYYPLSREDSTRIAAMMLQDIIQTFEEKKGIHITTAEDILPALAERGYSLEFGAREMRRTIIDCVENYLADVLLQSDIKRGGTITIRKEDLRLGSSTRPQGAAPA